MANYYGLTELQPIGPFYASAAYPLQANLASFPFGTAMGSVQGPTQNEEQTVSPPGSGNYYLSFLGQNTVALDHAASDTTVKNALLALSTIGAGNVTVASLVVSFIGAMAGFGQPLLTDPTGAATVARTQAGWTQYALAPFTDAVVTPPTTAPTLTASGTAGTLAVGAYTVCYTLVTAGGESTPSPCATIAVASTNSIVVTSITGLNAAVLSVNVYVNGQIGYNKAVTSGATGTITISALQTTETPNHAPNVNTAYTSAWGAMEFVGFIRNGPWSTNQFGQMSPSTFPTGDQQGSFEPSVPVMVMGRFNANDLVGLDAATLSGRGTVEQGSITTGVVRLF